MSGPPRIKSAILLIMALAAWLVACTDGIPAAKTATPRPPEAPLTPIEELGITGLPIEVDINEYRLEVDGLIDRPLALSYQYLLDLPVVTQVPPLVCPGLFVDHAEWTGPLVRTILKAAGIQPSASEVVFYDGNDFAYRATLTLDEALLDDTYLAHTLYGEPLPAAHGFPIRLVAGSKTGNYWVKWLFRIEVK